MISHRRERSSDVTVDLLLVIAHGSLAVAAICQHGSLSESFAARQSSDTKIDAAAVDKEGAASVTAKKGLSTNSGSVTWPADRPLPTFVRFATGNAKGEEYR